MDTTRPPLCERPLMCERCSEPIGPTDRFRVLTARDEEAETGKPASDLGQGRPREVLGRLDRGGRDRVTADLSRAERRRAAVQGSARHQVPGLARTPPTAAPG